MIAFAVDGPTPGNVSSWSDVAEFRLINGAAEVLGTTITGLLCAMDATVWRQ